MKVTVLCVPNCQPCDATVRHLTKEGIEFEKHMAADRPDLVERATALGHRATPVVFIDFPDVPTLGVTWDSYRYDRIKKLAKGEVA